VVVAGALLANPHLANLVGLALGPAGTPLKFSVANAAELANPHLANPANPAGLAGLVLKNNNKKIIINYYCARNKIENKSILFTNIFKNKKYL
jgi:hypothetical protein